MAKYKRWDDYDDDEYYSYGGWDNPYKKGKNKSYSSRDYSSWSWGTYGGYTVSEDDDESLYLKSHEGYLTPSSGDVSMRLDYKNDTVRNRDMIREFARFFYYKMLDDKDYFKEKYANPDPEVLSEQEIAAVEVKKQQYEQLWDKFIPGYTPLEKAIALFAELQREQEKKGKSMKESTDEDVLKAMSSIEIHEEIYKDPIFNELVDMQKLAKDNKMEILNKISMVENLGSQFKIEKEVTDKIVQNSRLITKKIMRDYGQLYQVDLYQRLLPTFKSKLLTKDLIINTPIERTEHKQKIIIMIDYSGSMSYPEKQKWVLAIMIDRLKYVVKEEAEVFFSFFVNQPNQLHFHHLYNRETVMKFWQSFSTSPNGGDTDIGSMIDRINHDINDKGVLCNLKIDLREEKPEVLIINDGQDSIKTKNFSYKTNAITIVDHENEELKSLCLANKGKYVYANEKGVKTYEAGMLKS